ncbi:MAG: transposase [Woeseiaceae bacterium]|jgi:putative transposase
MARMPRLVVPDYPHHVTQRGARRQRTFFSAADYETYLQLLAAAKADVGAEFWAYCLMPNHVHHVIVPSRQDSLAALFSEAHRRHTRHINFREDWRGHLWQERFHSFVMDERYLMATVRYVELNPVRAGLCKQPQDWPWSSARAHLDREDDALVSVEPMLARVGDWPAYLAETTDRKTIDAIRQHTRTGRPNGNEQFLKRLESMTGRSLRRKKPGRKASSC